MILNWARRFISTTPATVAIAGGLGIVWSAGLSTAAGTGAQSGVTQVVVEHIRTLPPAPSAVSHQIVEYNWAAPGEARVTHLIIEIIRGPGGLEPPGVPGCPDDVPTGSATGVTGCSPTLATGSGSSSAGCISDIPPASVS